MHQPDDLAARTDTSTADAATWTPDDPRPRPTGTGPDGTGMLAAELGMDDIELDHVGDANPVAEIARRIGDPGIALLDLPGRARLWIGGNSIAGPVNHTATRLLHRLMVDIAEGDCAASDLDRDRARMMLAINAVPTIRGRCLLTGIDADGATTGLGENLQSWLVSRLTTAATSVLILVPLPPGLP